jgi:cytochrome c oxidase subunit 2
MDSFPHHRNGFSLTVPHPGEWLGHCAEFCGDNHASMLFHVKAVPPAEFRQWLAGQTAAAALESQS